MSLLPSAGTSVRKLRAQNIISRVCPQGSAGSTLLISDRKETLLRAQQSATMRVTIVALSEMFLGWIVMKFATHVGIHVANPPPPGASHLLPLLTHQPPKNEFSSKKKRNEAD